MIQVRRAQDRGGADHGWLKTFHTFSFADYYDPNFMGFGALRVINDDQIVGGAGFPMHGHRDMEIVTVVLQGALEHRDTLGNQSVIRPGEVQRMSAGTGIRHSEFNHLREEPTHLYQIWILPDREGHDPGYEQKSFAKAYETQEWVLTVSNDGRNESMRMNQDAELWVAHLKEGRQGRRDLKTDRVYWLQVAEGEIEVQGQTLKTGDGLALVSEETLNYQAKTNSQLLFFELPNLQGLRK